MHCRCVQIWKTSTTKIKQKKLTQDHHRIKLGNVQHLWYYNAKVMKSKQQYENCWKLHRLAHQMPHNIAQHSTKRNIYCIIGSLHFTFMTISCNSSKLNAFCMHKEMKKKSKKAAKKIIHKRNHYICCVSMLVRFWREPNTSNREKSQKRWKLKIKQKRIRSFILWLCFS